MSEELIGADAAAAMLVIRLNELSQTFVPLYSEAVRSLLAAQERDGGWGDPMITAIALRALLCGQGHGIAIDRGLRFLANLQKPEGIWPSVPVRRMPTDAFASAFILMQLGGHAEFQRAVRFDEAIGWFRHNESALDEPTGKLWRQTRNRCRPAAFSVSATRRFRDQSSTLVGLFAEN